LKLLNRTLTSLSHRRRWARLGVRKLRSAFFLDAVRVAGRHIQLAYPEWDLARTEAECRHLFWDDPYGLAAMPATVATVIDVGANMGFFSLLARHFFPQATIHAYEPNPQMAPFIEKNTAALNVVLHREGLGRKIGRVSLVTNGNSLTAFTEESEAGSISVVPLSTAVQRIGGSVDLLKMDCEGAEWLTLEDGEGWRVVKHLAAEYHLAPGAERTLPKLIEKLNHLGFAITHLRESSNATVGLIQAENRRLSKLEPKTSCA
jgi:FkbM family methyltransferase